MQEHKNTIENENLNCSNCGQLLYFENSRCEHCGYPLGFVAIELQLYPLVPDSQTNFYLFKKETGVSYRYCVNHDYNVCNWLVKADSGNNYCEACSLNHTIPDLNKKEYRQRWNVIENGKHRLIYQLLRMKLPIVSKSIDPDKGLAFEFMADDETNGEQKILTGHDNGVVTLNIAEADDVEREMARKGMDEVYRTVLGHFRHEVGHYYWDILIDRSEFLKECRSRFGDDTRDYGEVLKVHYKKGAPANWNTYFISAYASTHPWEDWAHYLHIIDSMETAYSFGLSVHPYLERPSANLNADIDADPYVQENFDEIISKWFPLTFALNSVNRSMGLHDLYPFVIPSTVIEKLRFIHKVCYNSGG